MKHGFSILTLVAFLLAQLGVPGVSASSIDTGIYKTTSERSSSVQTLPTFAVTLEQINCCDPSQAPGIADIPQCESVCPFVRPPAFAFTLRAQHGNLPVFVANMDEFSLTPTKHPPRRILSI